MTLFYYIYHKIAIYNNKWHVHTKFLYHIYKNTRFNNFNIIQQLIKPWTNREVLNSQILVYPLWLIEVKCMYVFCYYVGQASW